MLRAVATQKAPVLLAASAVAVSHTGDTNETALATVSIPAGAMGLNGGIEIVSAWSVTNSANTKTIRARLGGISGTAFLNVGLTTSATASDRRVIRNRNDAASQTTTFPAASASGVGASSSAITTGTVDTSAAVDLVLSAQLASAAETITLQLYEVWLLPE